MRTLAYLDLDVPVAPPTGGEQPRRLLKPMVLAKLVQAAAVREGDQVLDVGCATGYSSALLARLARSVVALEQDPALARRARENLQAVGASNVTVVTGPLTDGWQAEAPYDVIFVNGATEVVPHALCAQLKDGGRLVAVMGRAAQQPRDALPLGRGRRQRLADLRRRRAVAPGLCQATPAFVF